MGPRIARCAVFLAALLAVPAAGQPEGWTALKISDKKRPTLYSAVQDAGRPALHARAEGSASLIARRAEFDLRERPLLAWRWKVSRVLDAADNSVGRREDAPARLVLAFEGDVSKLPLRDRAAIELSEKLSGRALPYATLMYVWATREPVDTLIANPHTRRVQMIVASSGAAGAGRWQQLERDVAADFRRAFGEEPGRLLAYGVMTDTDNTGEAAQAWYADIEFRERR